MSLLDKVIKLAHDNPETRKYLVPIIRKNAVKTWTDPEAMRKYLQEHPDANPKMHELVKPDEEDKKERGKGKEEVEKELGKKEPEKKEPEKKEPEKKEPEKKEPPKIDFKKKPEMTKLPSNAPEVKSLEWDRERQNWLKDTMTGEPKLTSVEGPVSKESVKTVMENAHSLLEAYTGDEMSPILKEDTDQIKEYLTSLDGMLNASFDDGSLAGANSTRLNNVIQTTMENLVYQTNEAYTRQLGDHGIRHILGNIKTQNSLFDSLEKAGKKISSKDKLMALMVQSNHDIGYATNPARDSFEYAGYHKEYSTQIVKDTLGADLESVFGKEGAEYIYYATNTHDAPNIDWDGDPVASAVRLADNLSLYSGEKLPALFREVPGSIEILEEMHVIQKDDKKSKEEKSNEIKELKKQLTDGVAKTKLSPKMKDALIHASEEVSGMTPKFTLGMMGGHLDKYEFKNGAMVIDVDEDDYETKLMEMGFDLGQSQFGKLAEAYGLDKKTLSGTEFNIGDPTMLILKLNKKDKKEKPTNANS